MIDKPKEAKVETELNIHIENTTDETIEYLILEDEEGLGDEMVDCSNAS